MSVCFCRAHGGQCRTAHSHGCIRAHAPPIHVQVAGLQVLQALGSSQDVAAEGHNYLLKKQDELTGRIHSAEADTQQQHLILQWDLTDK